MLRWSYKALSSQSGKWIWERADGIQVWRAGKAKAIVYMPDSGGGHTLAPGVHKGPEVAMNYVDRHFPEIYKSVVYA